jgi:hypothetical protein
VSHRPLATVTGLTIGDYLLWNWSLNANHDVLALISGLTLPPLTIACLWLVALTAARLIARGSRASARIRPGAAVAQGAQRRPRARWSARRAARAPRVAATSGQAPATPSASPTPARSSRKIAA